MQLQSRKEKNTFVNDRGKMTGTYVKIAECMLLFHIF